jgi:uncharacterized sporulation protein YeaH/YhbH (DUF444 family)
MRHHLFSDPARRWREEMQAAARKQAETDAQRRELDALERSVMKRVEAAERLIGMVLFEQEVARRQIRGLCEEVKGLREAILFEQKPSVSSTTASIDGCGSSRSVVGWVDLDE